MAIELLYEDDADVTIIQERKVAVIGFGASARAHALNLRDSGVEVVVGLNEETADTDAAREVGLPVMTIAEAAEYARVIMVAIPVAAQAEVFARDIAPHLYLGDVVLFDDAVSIHFGLVNPSSSVTVGFVAPKGPGDLVRRQFVDGKGVPALIAVGNDPRGEGRDIVLSYAAAIGAARAGIVPTSFEEAAVTDLFSGQVVLGGGLSELLKSSFDVLVDAGYSPEMAYLECVHELNGIVNALADGGLVGMRQAMSDVAEFGGYLAGERVVGEPSKEAMRAVLRDIQDGTFTRRLMADAAANNAELRQLRQRDAQHPMEETGAKMRSLMSWVKN